MKFDELTVEDILLLSSSVLRKPEIAKTLGVGEATVTRWRKKLDIKSKRGRPSVEMEVILISRVNIESVRYVQTWFIISQVRMV